MCNRFCPWCPCADKQVKESDAPSWMTNPTTEEENSKSLFGKSSGSSAKETDAPSWMTNQSSTTGNGLTTNPIASQRSLAGLRKPGAPPVP